ncbi:hypothetical protein [uncultured Roseobacter sp.]|uniref:hypothetical protein n=1 Tax=uncultured Roseobacter sp. TaxID=114847 RepID=UPI00260F9EF8|nr:hypothetical protein [uncultured Roseobacter sp.]
MDGCDALQDEAAENVATEIALHVLPCDFTCVMMIIGMSASIAAIGVSTAAYFARLCCIVCPRTGAGYVGRLSRRETVSDGKKAAIASLSFPDHVRRLNPGQGCRCLCERCKGHHPMRSPFDAPVILLDDVIHMLLSVDPDPTR